MSDMIFKSMLWTPKQELKNNPEKVGLLQLAFPIMLEMALFSTVNLVDVAFVSRISTNAVNAVSVSAQYMNICMILSNSVASGTMVCINQAIGMQNQKKVNMLASIAVMVNLCLGLLFGLMFSTCSPYLLKLMSLEQATLDAAARYMRLVGGLMIFQCIAIIFNQLIRSMGHTKAPLIINIATNIINLVGNYLVVFRRDIITVDPVLGVGMTTLLGQFVGMCIGMTIAFRSGIRIHPKFLRPFPWSEFKLALSIGVPNAINNMFYSVSQLVTTAIISSTGDIYVSTKVFVSNLVGYMFLVSNSFAQSNSIMVGYRLGAGKFEEAQKLAVNVSRMSIAASFTCTLIVLLLHRFLLGIFTTDEFILNTGKFILMIDLGVEVGRAINVSIGGSLNAAGDVRYMMLVNLFSSWFITVLGSYVFGVVLGWNLYGCWMCFAIDELFRGCVGMHRWTSGGWKAGAIKRKKVLAS